MNKTISAGNLTDDPKITYTTSGKAKAEFTLALNRMKDGADYPRFIAWEKKAEFLEKWCHKGMKLIVEGHIQTGSYKNNEGRMVYTTDIICDSIEFGGNKKQEEPKEDPKEDEWMNIPEGVQEELPFN